MDADLQHPPEAIETFVERWREGYVMVYGQRRDRDDESAVKRGFARLFYRLFARFGEWAARGAGDFRLIDRKGVEVLRGLGERARFSKGLYAWIGFKSIGVPFVVEERRHGRDQMELPQAPALRPRRHDLVLDRALAGVDLSRRARLPVRARRGALLRDQDDPVRHDVAGYPSLIVSIMFFSGVQLMSLGIIGEYIGRIFAEVKRRPLYVVAERVGDVESLVRGPLRDERRAAQV
jgi:glycosyltransferase involved in cell wall biosynthesis